MLAVPTSIGETALSTRGKHYHHGALREALIRAAMRIVARRGGATLTIREVARLTKVSHNAPYRHFESVAELREAVAEEGFKLLAADLAKASAHSRSAQRRRALGRAYVAFALKHPHLHQLMFNAETASGRTPGKVSAGERAFSVLLDALPGQGRARRVAALRAWAFVHGLATLIRDGQVAEDDPLLTDLLGR